MGRFKGVYDTARWKRLRVQVLREHPLCQYCGTRPATEVDHLVPIRDGVDPFDAENLRATCKQCHSQKTNNGERLRGCGRDGMPHDPSHPWYVGEKIAQSCDAHDRLPVFPQS